MSWFRHRVNPHWMPDHSPKKLTQYEKRHGNSRVHESPPDLAPKSTEPEKDQKIFDTNQKIG
jgi:hypothetical protein